MLIKFKNTYIHLGDKFYKKVHPIPVKDPQLVCFNHLLADELGINLNNLDDNKIAHIFSGNQILEGSEPIALVYAGHQYGHFVPELGDGRAILLGEITDRNGKQKDIQLKGSGQTPYSRRGDGRAALGPMIREYIVSEGMHALRIKTTRSLAIVKTNELVFRENTLPGGIITRIAASHIRIGTFEYFAAQKDLKSLKSLADYTINRHYPQVIEEPNPYQFLLKQVMKAQITLIIDWMRVGFIHGVMNTDNMTLSGETIDYGPCAFMDEYNPKKVFSSIDRHGRYAFNNQPNVGLWNLIQLSQSLNILSSLVSKEIVNNTHDLIGSFEETYNSKWLSMMSKKIGLINNEITDLNLILELLGIMQKDTADYTLTFRYLCSQVSGEPWPFEDLFTPSYKLKRWIKKWRARLLKQNLLPKEISDLMSFVNPAFIPRNHKIEEIIRIAIKDNDFSKMHTMLRVLANPYKSQQEFKEYMKPPMQHERVRQTFCGT